MLVTLGVLVLEGVVVFVEELLEVMEEGDEDDEEDDGDEDKDDDADDNKEEVMLSLIETELDNADGRSGVPPTPRRIVRGGVD